MHDTSPAAMISRVTMICLTAAMALSACSDEPDPLPDEARLPDAAVAALQVHLAAMSDGDLTCSHAAIEAAPRAVGFINDDRLPDFAISTQDLQCRSEIGSAVAYFCGGSICAFPALMSDGADYQVIWLMSGNEVSTRTDYQEARFVVRQGVFAGSAGSRVAVREYVWRDGTLTRVLEREEVAGRSP
ncbi:hypothetical protein [Maricaulis sp.]|uniref:hypothetical protein n=1 Tax=Maricaulis sp. TaxID=1486257 RepID=UPI002B269125|nr:hypothetical protein [Maricaulis sp.]